MRREERRKKVCFLYMAELRKLIFFILIRKSRSVIACSRLSDSGEDAKDRGRGESGRHAKRWRDRKKEKKPFPPVFSFFSCLRFLNSADPTISEPGTGCK